jgi:hypothetical protein
MTVVPRLDACTIVARNYLAHARSVAESFLDQHPGRAFTVLLIDGEGGEHAGSGVEVLTPAEIGIAPDELRRMATLYDVVEIATAYKPFLLRALLRRGRGPVAYLDPDIVVYSPLSEVAALAAERSIVLTPHTTEPMPRDGLVPGETQILSVGVYNLGFVAVGAGAEPFLDWWAERLARDCINAVTQSLFVDQRWIDFVPCYFDCAILRDPGHNVAYWNLSSRRLARWGAAAHTVNGRPLRFFHYSGYSPDRPSELSKFQAGRARITLEDPVLAELCAGYGQRLLDRGYAEARTARFGGDELPNGLVLDGPMRRLYRRELLAAERTGAAEPPAAFAADGGDAFLAWLRAPVGARPGLSRYLHAVWTGHAGLQAAFPDALGADADAYLDWLRHEGAGRLGLPTELLPGATGRPAGHVRETLLADARAAVVLALADEVADDPSLLAAYAGHVAADDDVSLVLLLPADDASGLEQRLVAAVEAAGLGEDSPDLLAVAFAPGQAAGLAHAARAVLTGRPPAPSLVAAPHVRPDELELLRPLLAEERRRAA